MRTLGLFVLCAIALFTGNGAPVEKRRESTKEILELESLLKKSAGEDKQVFPSQLQKEAKAKEARLAAESEAKEKNDGVDLPPVPPEMQVDGLAEKDELKAQLEQQMMATEKLKEKQEDAENDETQEEIDSEQPAANTDDSKTEDVEDEPEMMGEIEKREQELFMRYMKESPELWQQLMDSLEYGNNEDDWQQDKYANPDDEYQAVMQEWRAAAGNNKAPNYIPQYGYQQQYYPDSSDTEDTSEDSYAPEVSHEEGELENELPQIPREFSNLEELQEYYGDALAEEGSKKLGYQRPEWADADTNSDNAVGELEAMNTEIDSDQHNAQEQPSVQDHLTM